eukprot:TRINITY_DN4697_c0_g1_i2.p2 TRINITY_DN4697_c0_g1~~TRINITY_DN4697_c0_g1_i2.p2  ORF type:complete len:131 (+),score=19.37 TRINITY_DN4697_c0_g1_i2:662-1054(+)
MVRRIGRCGGWFPAEPRSCNREANCSDRLTIQSYLSITFRHFRVGEATSVPPGGVGWIDVRDVAKAHINAMEMADAHGRYLICSEVLSHLEIAQLLKEICPDAPVCVDKVGKAEQLLASSVLQTCVAFRG